MWSPQEYKLGVKVDFHTKIVERIFSFADFLIHAYWRTDVFSSAIGKEIHPA